VILVDSNILMYASGAEHPNKAPSLAFLRRVAAGEVEATVDAEALQEVIHRYRALHRWAEGRGVYELARTLFPEVLAITGAVMDYAKQIVDKDAPRVVAIVIRNLRGGYAQGTRRKASGQGWCRYFSQSSAVKSLFASDRLRASAMRSSNETEKWKRMELSPTA